MIKDQSNEAPTWMRHVLFAAAIYNILWGAWVVLFPYDWFIFAGMELPWYPQIWQCVGMIVGVYGVGYAIAALDPLKHWPIVLVGLMGKVLGPLGFAKALLDGSFPWKASLTTLTNDLVWWIPFTIIILAAFRRMVSRPYALEAARPLEEALKRYPFDESSTLYEASFRRPLLTCFLRHYG